MCLLKLKIALIMSFSMKYYMNTFLFELIFNKYTNFSVIEFTTASSSHSTLAIKLFGSTGGGYGFSKRSFSCR